MTSAVQEVSDSSKDDQQEKYSETQKSSLETGMAYPAIAAVNMHYALPSQLGNGNAAYPYADPYYRSIFAPYDAQSYPAQPMLMGIQQAGVPLPSDAVEEPVFVNAKQYHGIMRRRQSRAKAESEKKALQSKKPYLHESRHLHALRRARGCGGRFLTSKKNESQQEELESSDNKLSNTSLNVEKVDCASSENTS